MDLEEFLDRLAEHKSYVLIGICALIIAGNFTFSFAHRKAIAVEPLAIALLPDQRSL